MGAPYPATFATLTPAHDIIVDNRDAGYSESGRWHFATGATERHGPDARYAAVALDDDRDGLPDAVSARFTPSIPETGDYRVYAWNSCYSPRATNVPHRVHVDGTPDIVIEVNQDCATGTHGEWFLLGTFPFAASGSGYVEISNDGVTAGRYLGADAVRFESVASGEDPPTGSDSSTSASATDSTGFIETTTSGDSSTDDDIPNGPLSDEFSGASLDPDWQVMNANMLSDYVVEDGYLKMRITADDTECEGWPYCAWFDGTQGPFIFKHVTGSRYKITVRARARRASAPSQVVDGGFQFVGVMLRDPTTTAPAEDYVFNVTGERGGALSNEIKSTNNGTSSVAGHAYYESPEPANANADRELRLCRIDQMFYFYFREIGDNEWRQQRWREHYDRSETPLPYDLQLGLITYTYGSEVDIEGQVDFIQFDDNVVTAADCKTDE